MKKFNAMFIFAMLSLPSFASPQISPSTVTYRGTGLMLAKISLFSTQEQVSVDLVYVKDLTQSDSADIKLGSFELKQDRLITTILRLNITKEKPFWICVKSVDNGFPVRNCTTFKPQGINK